MRISGDQALSRPIDTLDLMSTSPQVWVVLNYDHHGVSFASEVEEKQPDTVDDIGVKVARGFVSVDNCVAICEHPRFRRVFSPSLNAAWYYSARFGPPDFQTLSQVTPRRKFRVTLNEDCVRPYRQIGWHLVVLEDDAKRLL